MDLRFDAARPRALLHELEARARTRPSVVRLDLSALDDIDSAGVATLRVASRRLLASGIAVELHGASPKVAHVLDDTPAPAPPAAPREPGVLERVGEASLAAWRGLIALADMTIEALRGTVAAMIGRRTFSLRDTLDQVERMGSDAIPIAATLSFLLGLVLAFQTWVQLHYFGTDVFVLDFVGVGMARGFAPFIVAILLAGRTAPAIAAELSTMEMRQENDVLRVMGISPVRHLVVPRMIAITVVIPSLSLVATACGIAGGVVVMVWLNPHWMASIDQLLIDLTPDDLWLGTVKSVLFGWVIGLASAFTGFHSGSGALSIGLAATRAAVGSIFFVMIVDSIVTTIWTMAQ
jgi:phospholipid/cholesterol/gamma-HCH transport system permease protein